MKIEEVNRQSSFFIMWDGSDSLLFAQKPVGNELSYYIWDLNSNTSTDLDLPLSSIAMSENLEYSITLSETHGLELLDMRTKEAIAVDLPEGQSVTIAYFLDVAE
jgi:hypothetical protein